MIFGLIVYNSKRSIINVCNLCPFFLATSWWSLEFYTFILGGRVVNQSGTHAFKLSRRAALIVSITIQVQLRSIFQR